MASLVMALAPGMAGSTSLFGVTIATASGSLTLAGSLLNLAGSLLLSAAARALSSSGSSQVRRELSLPDSLPYKRHVYGRTRATGTPIVWRVQGDYLYMCWLFNSRPSHGEFTLYLDKREVAISGDPYDFSGSGGQATEDPFDGHTTVWIGRGDQTQPPSEILADAPWAVADPDLFKASDAGRGCTIVWAKLRAGKSRKRVERWPNTPPQAEMDGKWARVWDPRDVAQDANDPETWTWSENHRLCLLDALRTNPVRPFQLRNLSLSQWRDAADIADQIVTLKSGGSEARYRLGGTLVFNGNEVEDLLAPMMLAGAADFVRSGGRLGVTTGVWDGAVYTLTDLMDYMTCSSLKRGEDLPTRIRTTYTSAAREYEQAELPPWDIPGAQVADGGVPSVVEYNLDWAASATQAMRVRKILGLKARSQRSLSGVAPPSAFLCLAGSVVQVSLPAPFNRRDGTYEVRSISPATDAVGVDGVALRCPIELIETGPEIYAWDPDTDEDDLEDPVYDSDRGGVAPPGSISVTSGDGVDLDTGGSIVPRFRFAFDPSTSSGVERYDWEWAIGSEAYASGGSIDGEVRDGSDQVYGYLNAAGIDLAHSIRVKAVAASGESDFVELTGAYYQMSLTGVIGTAGTGEATFDGTAPTATIFAGVQVFRAATGAGYGAAVAVTDVIAVTPGAVFSVTAGDPGGGDPLPAGDADFWVVPVTQTGSPGQPTGPIALTIL